MVTETIKKPPTKAGVWTQFWDMNSGGGLKHPPYRQIYIGAPEEEAIRIFKDHFLDDPQDIACECCGQNYSITESEDLQQATGYQRGCDWSPRREGYIEEPRSPTSPLVPLEEYVQQEDVLIIEVAHE